MAKKQRPLVVDLDGTLIKTDTLFERLVHYVSRQPLNLIPLIRLVGLDRASMKATLTQLAPLDAQLLPANGEVLDLLQNARTENRPVVLATASDEGMAHRVAQAWGPFDDVIASTPGHNLKAHNKASALVERFGAKNFDYIGNDDADIPVIAQASQAFLVSPSRRLFAKASATGTPVIAVGGVGNPWTGFIRALRPHQWAKNLLLFLPLFAAQLSPTGLIVPLAVSFVTFSVMASSVYLLNDVWDLWHDRAHPTKKNRPLARGDVSVVVAAVAAPALGVLSLAVSWWVLGTRFTFVLAIYALSTVAYSFWLKRLPLLDTFVLAGLYGIRLVAGAVVVGVKLSPWLIALSLFAFLSLALAKRFTELRGSTAPEHEKVNGRGYRPADASLIQGFGVVSGFMAGVILALYVEDPLVQDAYSQPLFLWLMVPAWLYWISRTWLLAHRGTLHDDPVTYALTDVASYVTGAVLVSALLLAR